MFQKKSIYWDDYSKRIHFLKKYESSQLTNSYFSEGWLRLAVNLGGGSYTYEGGLDPNEGGFIPMVVPMNYPKQHPAPPQVGGIT